MGGCCGKPVNPAEKATEYGLTDLQIEELVEFMASVDFGWPEMDRIHSSFNAIDTNKDGVLELGELMEVLGVEPSAFSAEIFRVFDRDEDAQIDFVEFVQACTRMCCASQKCLAHFAFRMVDADGSGSLSREELDKVLEIMYGACVAVRNHAVAGAGWQQQQHTEDATPADAGAAMFDFEQTRSKDGKLSAQEFVEATTNFPQVIEPAFRLQRLLQRTIVGQHFWAQRQSKLRRLFNDIQHDADARGVQGDWWGRYSSKYGLEPEDGKVKRRRRRTSKSRSFVKSLHRAMMKGWNSRDLEVARGPRVTRARVRVGAASS